MAMSFFDRVRVGVASAPGTGAVALGAAATGYRTAAAAAVQDQAVVSYVIEDGGAWEVGHGTYTASGSSLARTTVIASSNNGQAIGASANAIVSLTLLAEDLPLLGGGGRPQLTSLLLANGLAGNATGWRSIPWDTVDIDDVGAFSSSSPTIITVPSGFARVKLSFYTVFGNVNRAKPNRIDMTRGGNTTPIQMQGLTGINESGQIMVTRWLPVQVGDQFAFIFYDDGNGPTGTGSFGGPTYAQAEWSKT